MSLLWNNVEEFKGQNYRKLKKKYAKDSDLFRDPTFPPNENSLNLKQSGISSRVVWKRPKEICEDPKLFVEKANSKDVTQGRLGNCWFVATCSALATVKTLWKQVIPDYKRQEWDDDHPENYAGIFHFRFWQFGKRIDVVVDDLLPTMDGELIFCHSSEQNEFWSALLEKAYAKFYGSYGALDGGNISDALVDFTSGLSEWVDLKGRYTQEEESEILKKQIMKDHEHNALMSCAIRPEEGAGMESRKSCGLVVGHAYGITSMKDIYIGSTSLLTFFKNKEKITLIRLRNPWGATEWNGAFSDGATACNSSGGGCGDARPLDGHPTASASSSVHAIVPLQNGIRCGKDHNFSSLDGSCSHVSVSASSPCKIERKFAFSANHLLQLNSRSPQWNTITKHEKERLGLNFDDDGEFWMPFEDFTTEFTDLSICHLINTSIFSFRRTYHEFQTEGEWIKPTRAGGCPNYDSFVQNPQYCFDVPNEDMVVRIQLIQKDRRTTGEAEYKSIGFQIMKVEKNRLYRLHKPGEKVITSDYVKSRSIYYEGEIEKKGRYVLIPSSFEPGVETQYFLRIYSDSLLKVRSLKEDHPVPSFICSMFFSLPSAVTTITVKSASGLTRATNTYCRIRCERKRVKSEVVSDSDCPKWNLSAVFYRYNILQPISVQVWEKNCLRDRLLGCASISQTADNHSTIEVYKLLGKGHRETDKHPGEILVSVGTYEDLCAT